MSHSAVRRAYVTFATLLVLFAATVLAGVGAVPALADPASTYSVFHQSTTLGAAADVAFSPDGTTAYVINGEGAGTSAASASGGILVYDVASHDQVATIRISRPANQPGGGSAVPALAVVPTGATAGDILLLWTDGILTVIDPTTHAVVRTIGTSNTAAGASALTVLPNGTEAYVAEPGLGLVAVINLATWTQTATISGVVPSADNDGAVTRLVPSPDSSRVYVVGHSSGQIGVISTLTHSVVTTMVLDSAALKLSPGESLDGFDDSELGISPSGDSLYFHVTVEGSNPLYYDVVYRVDTSDFGVSRLAQLPDFDLAGLAVASNGRIFVGGRSSPIDEAKATDAVAFAVDPGSGEVTPIELGAYAARFGSYSSSWEARLVYAVAGTVLVAPQQVSASADVVSAFVVNATTAQLDGALASVGTSALGSLAMSPDGSQVYGASASGLAGVDLSSGAVADQGVVSAGVKLVPTVNDDRLVLSPGGQTAYVPLSSAGTVGFVSVASMSAPTLVVAKTVVVPGSVSSLALTPDGARLYAASGQSISVIDTATAQVVNTLTATHAVLRLIASPDGASIYVLDSTGVLSLIDVATGTISAMGVGTFSGSGGGFTLTPDGRYLLATSPPSGGASAVKIVNTSTKQVTTVSLGNTYSGWIAVTPDSRTAYLGSAASGESAVLALDIASASLTGTFLLPDASSAASGAGVVAPDGTLVVAGSNGFDIVRGTPTPPGGTSTGGTSTGGTSTGGTSPGGGQTGSTITSHACATAQAAATAGATKASRAQKTLKAAQQSLKKAQQKLRKAKKAHRSLKKPRAKVKALTKKVKALKKTATTASTKASKAAQTAASVCR